MVKKCASFKIGAWKIASDDGGLLLQLLFIIAIISAGIFVELNQLQWTIVILLATIFISTGVYRSAANQLIRYDTSISSGQAIRIRALSNILMASTAGISFFIYLIIFMPKINQLL
jgi:hypothetical protein